MNPVSAEGLCSVGENQPLKAQWVYTSGIQPGVRVHPGVCKIPLFLY
jgi:hypothetical protein